MDEQRENVENGNMQEQETPMASAHLSERREMRYEVPIEIEISGLDRKGLVFHERTLTRNVSEWGCGFTTLVELKVDDIIALRVSCPDMEESLPPQRSLFQVVRVTPDANGWLVGAWKMDRGNIWTAVLRQIADRELVSHKLHDGTTSANGEPVERDTDQ